MEIKAHFSVEKIENGFIVRHVDAGRTVHVPYEFNVARQIEQFMHDAAVQAWEDRAALEANYASSVHVMQVEG